MTVAEKIHNGASADDLGMSEVEWDSRKKNLDAFLQSWNGVRFEEAYLLWVASLPEEEAGTRSLPPSLKTQAKTATKAAADFISSGFKKVARVEHDRRVEVCDSCSDLAKGRCIRCGCFMTLKAWLPSQNCPIGKW